MRLSLGLFVAAACLVETDAQFLRSKKGPDAAQDNIARDTDKDDSEFWARYLQDGGQMSMPETGPVACTLELKICPDGSSVGRTGPNCEFEPCPESVPGACPLDVQACPDGSIVDRDPANNCEFAPCPDPVASPTPPPTLAPTAPAPVAAAPVAAAPVASAPVAAAPVTAAPIAAAPIAAAPVAAAPVAAAPVATADIVDTAIAAGSFTTLVDLVTIAGLVDTLRGEGPFTVFAPTDAAFPSGADLDAFKADTDLDTLTSILTYHVVPGIILSTDLMDGATVTTVEGSELTISLANGAMVNNANIVTADIATSNGVIHVIDAVLMPPSPPTGSDTMTPSVTAAPVAAAPVASAPVAAAPVAAAPVAAAPVAAAPVAAAPVATADIVDTAIAAGSFTTLVDLVTIAGLVDTLRGEGPFTVFAPTDAAFPSGADLDAFKADTDLDTLTSILTYHVVPGIILSTDLMDGATVTTVEGSELTISLANGAMVNNANIVTADIATSNGVIHVIDAVLMPPSPPTGSDTMTPSVTAAPVAAAPVASAPVAAAPVAAAPIAAAPVAAAPVAAAPVATADIVDTAIAAGSFTTLVDLVTIAGLVDTLRGEGPFTVFAPTDAAFPSGADLDAFKADTDLDTLTSILTYHVVPGIILSTDLMDGATVTTVEGSELTISLANGAMVNNANIVTADIATSNGVIHVIDAVLMPPSPSADVDVDADLDDADDVDLDADLDMDDGMVDQGNVTTPSGTMDIVDTAIAAGSFTTLVDLVAAAGLVDTLRGEGPFTVFAPTDAAFPSGADLDAFKADTDLDTLTSILTYHVVPGIILSTDLMDGATVTTVEGSELTISLANGAMVNNANIVTADIATSNGVIHVIDAILTPPPSADVDVDVDLDVEDDKDDKDDEDDLDPVEDDKDDKDDEDDLDPVEDDKDDKDDEDDLDPDDAVFCTADVLQCTDGSFVGRDPEEDCAYLPCPRG